MPHATIAGMTKSGKTHCARQLAMGFVASGVPTLVLHKPREPWDKKEATTQTPDPETFLALYKKIGAQNEATGKTCAAFMELSDAAADKYDERFHKCYSEGRHSGFRNFFLTQRAQFVHPAIRENCELIYLFNCTPKACDVWVEEFNDEKLSLAAYLPPHYFLHKKARFAPARLYVPVKGRKDAWLPIAIGDVNTTRKWLVELGEKLAAEM